MQIVNGYVCQTSCDVSAARAGHDPKNPHDDPMKARQLAEQKAVASGRPLEGTAAFGSATPPDGGFSVDAVTFGGRLAALSVPRGSSTEAARRFDRTA